MYHHNYDFTISTSSILSPPNCISIHTPLVIRKKKIFALVLLHGTILRSITHTCPSPIPIEVQSKHLSDPGHMNKGQDIHHFIA